MHHRAARLPLPPLRAQDLPGAAWPAVLILPHPVEAPPHPGPRVGPAEGDAARLGPGRCHVGAGGGGAVEAAEAVPEVVPVQAVADLAEVGGGVLPAAVDAPPPQAVEGGGAAGGASLGGVLPDAAGCRVQGPQVEGALVPRAVVGPGTAVPLHDDGALGGGGRLRLRLLRSPGHLYYCSDSSLSAVLITPPPVRAADDPEANLQRGHVRRAHHGQDG